MEQVALSTDLGIHLVLHLAGALGGDPGAPAICGGQGWNGRGAGSAIGNVVPSAGWAASNVAAAAVWEACPGDSVIAGGKPRRSTIALHLVLDPARERPGL